MAPKSARSGAPAKRSTPSGKKKARHTSAQKKAARIAREQAQRAARRPGKSTQDDAAGAARRRGAPPRREQPQRERRPAPAAGSTRRPSAKDRARHEVNRPQRRAAPAEEAAVPPTTTGDFTQLGLDPRLVAALTRHGITSAFPIQRVTIPDALAGRDVLGRGQTGSGKTLAFGLPLLHRLRGEQAALAHRPHALVLTPTRELAMQVVEALAPLASALQLRHQLVAGGMPYAPQLRSLERGVDVLVATPGRLSDLIERGAVDLSDVRTTVIDEADHMAEMGFVEVMAELLDRTPPGGQRLLFSATLDHGVDTIADRYLHDPVTHSTQEASASVSTMEHHVFLVHPHEKKEVTAAVVNRPGRTVVFVRTKLGADRVATQLREAGVFAAALHGGLNQAHRTRVLAAFRAGELPVLVATDVAARGIHVDDVTLVLQADPPADHKDYLHRAGRTARAGSAGAVVTLALPHQHKPVQRLLAAAGVHTEPKRVGPQDEAVIVTAGGAVPTGEAVPQSRLDAVMRPRRGARGPRKSAGGHGTAQRRQQPRRGRDRPVHQAGS